MDEGKEICLNGEFDAKQLSRQWAERFNNEIKDIVELEFMNKWVLIGHSSDSNLTELSLNKLMKNPNILLNEPLMDLKLFLDTNVQSKLPKIYSAFVNHVSEFYNRDFSYESSIVLCLDPRTSDCVFVSRRNKPEELGGMPGGKLESHETPNEAASREFEEETGFTCQIKEKLLEKVFSEIHCNVHLFLGTMSTFPDKREWINPEGDVCRLRHWTELIKPKCAFYKFNQAAFSLLCEEKTREILIKNGYFNFADEIALVFNKA